jgi:CRISPR system Cascade subunit CasC
MLIDIHILQSHAPSNLNRDDTGAPKDAFFGEALRARISSQCLKRSIRRSEIFEAAFRGERLLAERTRRLPRLLGEELVRQGVPADITQAIVRRAPEFGRESTKGRGEAPADGATDEKEAEDTVEDETKQLIFLSLDEVPPLAAKLARLCVDKGVKAFEKMKIDEIVRLLGPSTPRSIDVAMFGRMTTSAAFSDMQAAVQVAHALSTHPLEQEFDYYTAVDDISGKTGAGFIGDTAFNSATYYKYLSVHWEGLVKNVGDAAIARRGVVALLEAAAQAQPSGKQNSFAAHNLPDFMLVEVRERNVPISYANAFLKPVRATRDQSLMERSVAELNNYLERIAAAYDLPAERAYFTTTDETVSTATRVTGLAQLIGWLPIATAKQPVA